MQRWRIRTRNRPHTEFCNSTQSQYDESESELFVGDWLTAHIDQARGCYVFESVSSLSNNNSSSHKKTSHKYKSDDKFSRFSSIGADVGGSAEVGQHSLPPHPLSLYTIITSPVTESLQAATLTLTPRALSRRQGVLTPRVLAPTVTAVLPPHLSGRVPVGSVLTVTGWGQCECLHTAVMINSDRNKFGAIMSYSRGATSGVAADMSALLSAERVGPAMATVWVQVLHCAPLPLQLPPQLLSSPPRSQRFQSHRNDNNEDPHKFYLVPRNEQQKQGQNQLGFPTIRPIVDLPDSVQRNIGHFDQLSDSAGLPIIPGLPTVTGFDPSPWPEILSQAASYAPAVCGYGGLVLLKTRLLHLLSLVSAPTPAPVARATAATAQQQRARALEDETRRAVESISEQSLGFNTSRAHGSNNALSIDVVSLAQQVVTDVDLAVVASAGNSVQLSPLSVLCVASGGLAPVAEALTKYTARVAQLLLTVTSAHDLSAATRTIANSALGTNYSVSAGVGEGGGILLSKSALFSSARANVSTSANLSTLSEITRDWGMFDESDEAKYAYTHSLAHHLGQPMTPPLHLDLASDAISAGLEHAMAISALRAARAHVLGAGAPLMPLGTVTAQGAAAAAATVTADAQEQDRILQAQKQVENENSAPQIRASRGDVSVSAAA